MNNPHHSRKPLLQAASTLLLAVLVLSKWSHTDRVDAAPLQTSTRSAPATNVIPPNALKVDTTKSRVFTFVGKTGLGHEHGIEGRLKSGHLVPGAETDAGQLVFDMRSFDADTPAARRFVGLSGTTDAGTRQEVNNNMRGSSILNVARYPTAVFDIETARQVPTKNNQSNTMNYELSGRFTLHGVTRPLKIIATARTTESGIHLRGSFMILQTQFGITPFSKAFGAVGITDQLKISGEIYLTSDSISTN